VARQWHHGRHHGRQGWWWVVGNGCYFYTTPAYPYPVYLSTAYDDTSPAEVSWYCDDPPGYYPELITCNGAWREVPSSSP
jgi:hypothetical protein